MSEYSERDEFLQHELRADLRQRAAGHDGAEDWDDLTARLRKVHRRRQRVLAGVGVVAVLATGAAAFAVGQSRTSHPDAQVSALAPKSPAIPSTPVPVVPRPTEESSSFASGTNGVDRGTAQVFLSGVKPYGGGLWFPSYEGQQPMGRLFVRTTVAGVTLRAYRADYGPYDDGNPFWDPPGWCFPNGVVQADASTDTVAGVSGGSTFAAAKDGTVAASWGLIGVGEGEPTMIVTAQVPAGADAVRAVFPGGAADSMDTVDGIAVVAAPVSASALDNPSITVQALSHGSVVATATLGSEYASPDTDPACQVPPVTLPPPGEQPADPQAARAAIQHDFDVVYGSSSEAEKEGAVDDPDHSLAAIRQQLATGPFADAVKSAHAEIADLVFDRPDHAWVQYKIITTSGTFSPRFAEVSVIDGQWLISEASVCKDVSLAGIQCSG